MSEELVVPRTIRRVHLKVGPTPVECRVLIDGEEIKNVSRVAFVADANRPSCIQVHVTYVDVEIEVDGELPICLEQIAP